MLGIFLLIFQMLLRLAVVFLKFIIYTGIYIPIAYLAFTVYLDEKYMFAYKHPEAALPLTIILYLTFIPSVIITIRNLIKTFSVNKR